MDIISTDYESVGRVGGGVGHALYIQKKNENWGCVSTIRLLVSLQLLGLDYFYIVNSKKLKIKKLKIKIVKNLILK